MSLAALYACLLLLLVCGLGELLLVPKEERPSYTENRMLCAFPELTGESLSKGDFMDGFESWLSDGFFFRDAAAAFSDGIKDVFRLRSENEAVGPVDASQICELNEEESQQLNDFLEEIAREGDAEAAEPGAPLPAADADGRLPTPEVTQSASLWVESADGRRISMETFPPENIATLARILNEYRAALPADGTVNLINPMVSDIANRVLREHTAVDWACDLDDVMQPYLDEGVCFYDLTDIIRPYVGQYTLYPTIDHHWHPITCKIAQSAMLCDQGVVPNSYDEYRYWLADVYDAGPFDTQELAARTRSIEQVPVLVLNAPAESYMIEHLNQRSPGVLIVREGYGGYAQYLGGNRHPWREFVTAFHTGRNALVIGDSFDLAFITYLFPYYDTVMVTDFRDGGYPVNDVGASVREYIEYYDISDVYIVYCSYFSLNTDTVQDRMERYFFMDYGNRQG